MTILDIYGMTWRFTPHAIETFKQVGPTTRKVLKSFALRVLSMNVVREGETEINFFGIGVRVFKRGKEYTVDSFTDLEEMGFR